MADATSVYLKEVRKTLAAGIATEHTYRPGLKALVEALGSGITAFNDPKRVECGAPDFTVARDTKHGPLTIGYIEAKDVGTDLEPIERDANKKNPTTPNGDQLKRYLTLPNLILTDYLEFRWYVDGERRMMARLGGPVKAGGLRKERDGREAVVELIAHFLDHEPPTIAKPKDLAIRMARLTHRIRDMIITAIESDRASHTLRDLRRAFEETLVPDLSIPDFGDMYAQTLAYGLFAARVNHGGPQPFKRLGAAAEIPKTNPFLRRLFDTITGAALDDEPYVGFVDDVAQLLDSADILGVLADFGKRGVRQDPVLHFYETFLAAYDPTIREMRGVYYTPEPVVSYIVRSLDYLLRTRFGCPEGLADASSIRYVGHNEEGEGREESCHRVLILDPACGTGTFLYAVVDLIREEFMRRGNAGMWPAYVREHLLPRLFGFELMMAPYAMAHLKLGMQLAALDMPEAQRANWACDLTGDRLGVYLTNTLEEAIKKSEVMMASFISDEANAAVRVKRELPILVVLGNPPYQGHSANRSEIVIEVPRATSAKGKKSSTKASKRPATVKKRVKTFIGRLIEDYKRDYPDLHKPAQAKWLQDDYVKFIRFGQWRIQQTGAGVLGLITNHKYLDNPTFRGMRQQLMNAFTDIYVLDLHGNSKKKERCPDGSPDENVFDIQQGVAIALFVKQPGVPGPARVKHAHLWGLRNSKYTTLSGTGVESTPWAQLQPRPPWYFFVPRNMDLEGEYNRGWRIADAMDQNGDPAPGIVTTHDEFAISWSAGEAADKVRLFLTTHSEAEARQLFRLCSQSQWNYERAKRALSTGFWGDKLRTVLYRPFDLRWTVFDPNVAVHRRLRVMRHMLTAQNVGLIFMRQVSLHDTYNHFLATRHIVDNRAFLSAEGIMSLAPLYLYPEEAEGKTKRAEVLDVSPWPSGQDGRRPNLAPAFVGDMEKGLDLTFVPDGMGNLHKTFGPEDVFHYIYAVLHSPTYRTRYAEFLKTDFPRIPPTTDASLFRRLCALGAELVALHLIESPLLGKVITSYPIPGDDIVDKVTYRGPGEPEPGSGKPLEKGRVYISEGKPKEGHVGQYFEAVPPEVWNFHVGGYQVCQKWLKDRKGRVLSYDERVHYQKIVVALQDTIRVMGEIDQAIPSWPLP